MKQLKVILLFFTIYSDCYGFNLPFSRQLIRYVNNNKNNNNNKYISIRSQNISHTHNNVSLVIFKGSHIPAEKYIGISKTIRHIGTERGLNINVKIPYDTKSENIKRNLDHSSFILGHSSGVYDFLSHNSIDNNKNPKGLIQVGSVLNSNGKLPWQSRKLESFPIPTMTFVGQKDGCLRHTYCLDELYPQNDTEKYITKPIIISKDITHLHISNTTATDIAKLIGLNDLTSTININRAWYILASCIVDFIILNMNHTLHNVQYNSSFERMQNRQKETQDLLGVYVTYNDSEYISRYLTNLHKNLINKNNTSHIVFYDYRKFIRSKPTDSLLSCYIQDKNILSKMYFTSLWIKTKYKTYIPAKNINEQLYTHILRESASYQTSLKIVFEEDKKCFTALQWLITEIKIKRIENTVYIQSPIFITNNNTFMYKNFYYMKILSPAQIAEMIHIDLQDI